MYLDDLKSFWEEPWVRTFLVSSVNCEMKVLIRNYSFEFLLNWFSLAIKGKPVSVDLRVSRIGAI